MFPLCMFPLLVLYSRDDAGAIICIFIKKSIKFCPSYCQLKNRVPRFQPLHSPMISDVGTE